jgi:hypothetical protein
VRPLADGPHIRLGLAWIVVATVATVAGTVFAAVLFSAVAALAGAQAARSWRAHRPRPIPGVALVVAAAVPAAAASGAGTAITMALITVVAAVLVRAVSPGGRSGGDLVRTVVIAVPIGIAAAAPVLLRKVGVAEPMALLAYAGAYDAGSYLVGTGARTNWEGPAAGIAAVVPVTLIAALALAPPLPAAAPFALGLVAATATPLGPVVASVLLGDRRARVPALRRLDSLIVLGPVWGVCAVALR